MIITSPAFNDNGIIPNRYTGFGEDVSPEFTVTDAPEKTESFVIILDDSDVPFVKIFNHWLICNIPKVSVIPEGLPKGAVSISLSAPARVPRGESTVTEGRSSRSLSETSIGTFSRFMLLTVSLIYRKIPIEKICLTQ